MNKKVKSLAQVAQIAAQYKKAGKTVGLITGCFDVVHAGHVDLFRFAKKHCDLVIVGLDSDETIRINKGPNRPIHNISQREKVLCELESIDLIFRNEKKINFANAWSERSLWAMSDKIMPNYLITNPMADKFWKMKENRAKLIGAKLLLERSRKDLSSTRVFKFFAGER